MQEVCIACHGSRVGNEYLGKNESCQPDVHYKKAHMTCDKCHKAEQMHGDGRTYARRHDVENGPKCTECHENIYESEAAARSNHMTHRDKVSCQVCHSQSYTNCFDCHVGMSKDGREFYEVGSHSLDFKIGLNPSRSERRKERFVLLRHAPVARDTFSFYKNAELTEFDSRPTWKMATPHNIQRKTFQNSECNHCHGNQKLFLQKKDVRAGEVKANYSVVVPSTGIPARIKGE
ncbi:MAG: hypothetical protein JRJ85_12985 [Deltaproteobacteria bacterium]|nr:hypothetical protein [Deltaproteobacteria bacterium]